MQRTYELNSTVSWTHHHANGTTTPLSGVVVATGTDSIVAKTEMGALYQLHENDETELESDGTPEIPAREPETPQAQNQATPPAEPATAPAAATDQAPTADPGANPIPGTENAAAPPAAEESPKRIGQPVAIRYFGPAYAQALDMIAEATGRPELKRCGHAKGPGAGPDEHETLYIFLATRPDQVHEIQQGLRHSRHAHLFGPDCQEPTDDEVQQAAETVAGGELPVLE